MCDIIILQIYFPCFLFLIVAILLQRRHSWYAWIWLQLYLNSILFLLAVTKVLPICLTPKSLKVPKDKKNAETWQCFYDTGQSEEWCYRIIKPCSINYQWLFNYTLHALSPHLSASISSAMQKLPSFSLLVLSSILLISGLTFLLIFYQIFAVIYTRLPLKISLSQNSLGAFWKFLRLY